MIPLTCWVLNLDAEIELDRLQHAIREQKPGLAHRYATAEPLRQKIAPYAQRFASQLPPNARVLDEGARPLVRAKGVTGLCWCPTPSALEQHRRAGAEPAPAPPPAVLLRVNHRLFCAELGQTLEGAQFVQSAGDLNALLQRDSGTGAWLCKRPFGFAGRGQRRIAAPAAAPGAMRADDQRWLTESIAHGGLQVEPFVDIRAEYSVHGLVDRDGNHRLGSPCEQRVDEYRAWTHARLAEPTALSEQATASLLHEASRVAQALAQAGYFGPFCVDSYTWCHTSGALQLNPRSEINARLTMAYPLGMGENWLGELLAALKQPGR